jgi:hypothetical protein
VAASKTLAIDWSGRRTGAEEFIWLAEARDGVLVDLRNGMTRAQVVTEVIAAAKDDADVVVGLDFAFSFPRWWCEDQGWATAKDVWHAMHARGEDVLAACEPPFWGRPDKVKPAGPTSAFRRTELDAGAVGAKSVFQIGGAGAVGTGSIRGMPQLLRLAEAGFSIWPFDAPASRRAVEIYPRALTGPVRKSRWAERHAYLVEHHPAQCDRLLERAAGSEDAFDAAVSAVAMSSHAGALAALPQTRDPDYALEGRIWTPTVRE